MLKKSSRILLKITCLLVTSLSVTSVFSLGDDTYVVHKADRDGLVLADKGKLATLYVDANDHKGLLRAVGDLQSDFGKVTGKTPDLVNSADKLGAQAVIIGSLGNSQLLDSLVERGKLDVSGIEGQWEAFRIQLVENPVEGVGKALVIAGSDMRGAIFGVYDLSQQIGVSPWYWWADVPVQKNESLYVKAGTAVQEQPKVQYRGIFLNDEAPALTGWVTENYGNYNSEFYVNVFELLLRLKANFLWPAMWNNAFSVDDPLNPKLANEYGIVMSTSHHEPMMRAHKEWHGMGEWNYATNGKVLREFWRGGVERNKPYENIITLAMRGDGDTAMSEEANVSLLEKIVEDQREIIADVYDNKSLEEIPQVWALYKEVQDYYEKGMRVPDDVILLWCDDNWGNIRRLPTLAERKRRGGAGIYYHFDYVGGPRSYRWINTVPLAKIWEQMNLAYEYEANRIWIVNVGDLKPMEYPIEYFLEMAWNPEQWPRDRIRKFGLLWAEREFGSEFAQEVEELMTGYTRHNGRRKPELQDGGSYSLLNYREAERISAELDSLVTKAEKLLNKIPDEKVDAFYQLVYYPVVASANVTKMHIAAGKNQLYAMQGRPLANQYLEQTQTLFAQDAALENEYHTELAGGKWNHMMSQPRIGYMFWNNPPANIPPKLTSVKVIEPSDMGIAVEGMVKAFPQEGARYQLPKFTPYGQKERFLDLFNRGTQPYEFEITTDEKWIKVNRSKGTVEDELRVLVSIDWKKAPTGQARGSIVVHGASWGPARILVEAQKPEGLPSLRKLKGFVETDGYVSIEAEHFSKSTSASQYQWGVIEQHGRTLSSLSVFPVTDHSFENPGQGPSLEYKMYLFEPGEVTVHGYFAPTWPISPERGLQYAVAFDDQEPVIVDILEGNSHTVWQESVRNGVRTAQSKHTLDRAGYHTLKVWAVDPAVTVQKWVVDTGGLQDSYLGPPESVRR